MTTEMNTILEHALTDTQFMGRLLTDPASAAAERGVVISAADAELLTRMSAEEVKNLAAQYASDSDSERRRTGC